MADTSKDLEPGINHQPSAINHQPSAISHQPSALGFPCLPAVLLFYC